MKATKRQVIGIGAVLALSIFIGWQLFERPNAGTSVTDTTDRSRGKESAGQASGGNNIASATPEEWRRHADARVDATRNAYKNSDDLKSFFNSSMAHPEAGGFYYARLVHFDCAGLHAAAARITGSLPKEIAAALARCGDIGTPVSSGRIVNIGSTEGAAQDPLFSMSKAALSKTIGGTYNLSDAKVALQQAIELGDPYGLQEQFYRGLAVANTFDGKAITPIFSNQITAATMIVACDLGADCTRPSSVSLSCIQDGGCQSSLVDLTLNGKSDAERVVIFQLSQQIMAATFDGTLPSLLGKT